CGCAPMADLEARTSTPPKQSETLGAIQAERGARVAREVANALASRRSDATAIDSDTYWAGRVQDAFVAEIAGAGAAGTFLMILEDALRARLTAGDEMGAWQDALSSLRHGTRGWFEARADLAARAEDLCQEARVLVGRYAEVAHAAERARVDRLAHA